MGCLSHGTQHRSCEDTGVEQEQGSLEQGQGKDQEQQVLTSRRSLVLHSGDKEKKNHQSLNPHRRHPKHSKPRTWGAVFPFLTQTSHPSPQHQPWAAAGASNIHFLHLHHSQL